MSFDLVDYTPTAGEIAIEATNQHKHACEQPYVSPDKIVERYVSILENREFQQTLVEATEFKRGEIARFREMLGRSAGVHSLNKFA